MKFSTEFCEYIMGFAQTPTPKHKNRQRHNFQPNENKENNFKDLRYFYLFRIKYRVEEDVTH